MAENEINIQPLPVCDERTRYMVAILDRYQVFLYGQPNVNLEPLEQLQANNAFMLGAFINGEIIGIAAIKLQPQYGEIKRMFVKRKYHGTGAAPGLLNGLESYARQQNRRRVKLETGRMQFAAIRFYEKQGYLQTGPFGNYTRNPVSIYFQKNL